MSADKGVTNTPPFLRMFHEFWLNTDLPKLNHGQRGSLVYLMLEAWTHHWPEFDIPEGSVNHKVYDAFVKYGKPYLELERDYYLRGEKSGTARVTVDGWFKANPEQDELFKQFHKAYPRKDGEVEPRRAWKDAKIKPEFFSQLMKALEAQIKSGQLPADKERKRFCKQESRWIRGKHWQDEIIERSNNGDRKAGSSQRGLPADENAGYIEGQSDFTKLDV
ncbi:MAG: hypothetical protein KOO63_05450 [Bacteroidales bacterium]|nr:hypothetical protein [Candidatus Latescibacterota bacterium]